MSKNPSAFATHHQTLETYNHLKLDDDPTYKKAVYLANAMREKGYGKITMDGRVKFTTKDVQDYLQAVQRDKARKAALEQRGDPRYGISPRYKQLLGA